MENDNIEEVVLETVDNQEDVQEETQEETREEITREKPSETLEQRKARLERQLNQTNKKLGIDDKPEQKSSKKSDGLDYGQKAYLLANGIKEGAEVKMVQDIMQETGKSLEQVLGSKYFQAELKEARELQASSNAVPTGKRSGGTGQESVDYWLAKGELPPASDVDLRRKVVNARLQKVENKGVFYNS